MALSLLWALSYNPKFVTNYLIWAEYETYMTKCKQIISVLPFTCGIICCSYCTICCTNKASLLTEGNVPMWCGWNAGTCLNASVTHKDLPLFLRIQFPMGSWQSILANISTESVVQNNYRSINVHLKSLTAFCCTDGYFICSFLFLFIWSWQMDWIEGIDLESVCIIFEWTLKEKPTPGLEKVKKVLVAAGWVVPQFLSFLVLLFAASG